MPIKVYESAPNGRIVLIENVREVIVHMGSYGPNINGPERSPSGSPLDPVVWRDIERIRQ